MKLQDFDYALPIDLIAQYPLLQRDRARLMVVERFSQKIRHHLFSDIEKFFPPKSLIVLNDSKVIPARLLGNREKTGGRVEVFLLHRLSDGYSYEAMIRPLRRLKIGEKIIFPKSSRSLSFPNASIWNPDETVTRPPTTINGSPRHERKTFGGDSFERSLIYAQLIDAQKKIVKFNRKDVHRYLRTIGHLPLPPYIKREDTKIDQEYYQTVYARNPGSVAAPTAGLHFTNSLLKGLKSQGHQLEKVTLHVNYATFSPVKEEDITKHRMDEEQYLLSAKTQTAIRKTREEGRRIVCVGTTSCRVLETLAAKDRGGGGAAPGDQNLQRAAPPRALEGKTNIFITPGYNFQMTDILITNFHLPKSTLLMLVYAFGSPELMKKAYQEAIAQKYRFYSYGDAMMII